MTRYRWRTWAANTRSVEADTVDFEPAHVVFRRRTPAGPEVVLAVANYDVNNLTIVPEEAAHDDF